MKTRCIAMGCLAVMGILVLGTPTNAAIPEPTMASVAPSAEEVALVQEGVALHEKGDFAAAAAKYAKALDINPQNVEALYELAFTLDGQREFEKALETARRGTLYWSPLRGPLYMIMGNCLDKLGRPAEALEYLEEAGKLQPDNYMVQYNLALTLYNAARPADAAQCLKRAITSKPDHPSSHLLLGAIWQAQGLRIPALMAYTRFLVLEPTGARSRSATASVKNMVEGTARVERGQSKSTIFVQMDDPKKEEGDFSAVLGTLSLIQGLFGATKEMVKEGKADEGERLAEALSTMCRTLGDEKIAAQKTFACALYAAYFAEASTKGHDEALSNYVLQSSGFKGPQAWLEKKENAAKVKAFLEWSKAYDWPDESVPAPAVSPAAAPAAAAPGK